MIPEFKIPKDGVLAAIMISKLSDEQFNELCNLYQNIPLGISFKSISGLKNNVGLNSEEMESINQLVINILSIKNSVSDINVVQNLVKSILYYQKDYDLLSEVLEPEILKQKFDKLFNINGNISLTHKAQSLLSSNQRLVDEISVLTDIRPVLDPETDNFNNFVIIHRLELKYTEDFEDKVMYFSFDSDNLKKLKEKIIRAESKEVIFSNKLKDLKINKISKQE